MAEEHRLIATITPKIDSAALRESLAQALKESFNVPLNVGGGGGGGTGSFGGGTVAGSLGGGSVSAVLVTGVSTADELKTIVSQRDYRSTAADAYDTKRRAEEEDRQARKRLEAEDEATAEEGSRRNRNLQMISRATGQLAGAGMSLLKNSFGVLEDILNRMKSASPLLQSIEALFNLAMTLFFMPLGNKLAEVILPATLELVDKVVEMWDSFEGMTLSEMFEHAFSYGVDLIADYFQNIGGLLEEQGGLLGSIGSIISWIGDFIDDKGYGVLNGILNVIQWVLDNIKLVISLIVAFYAMQYASNIALMSVIASSNSLAGWFGAGAVVAIGAAAGLATYGGLTMLGLADGGHVPAREGGWPTVIGEGGEGEWVIPDSKAENFGATYNYYTFNGYNGDDIERIIEEKTSQQISLSRLKGGF